MTLVCTISDLPKHLKHPVVTIGNFDGVHRGHQAIFREIVKRAKSSNGTSVVTTFEPHPVKIINPGKKLPLLTSLEQKRNLLISREIDILLLLDFTLEFAAMSARSFVKDILVNKLGAQEIVVGYDYVFGNKREGNVKLLKEMGREFGFDVHRVGPVYVNKEVVSSTSIRNLILGGDVSGAKKLLGRNYQIKGEVVKGKNRGGSMLGYPTANIRLSGNRLIPKQGVYVVAVEIQDRILPGLTNIGYNPTFKENSLSIETHILDMNEDILKKEIRVNFLSRLRDEMTFSTPQELSKQIKQDIKKARDFFQKEENRL